MWFDQEKWVLCRALSNFSFVVYLVKQSESFILLKTTSESDLRFQRYTQFCPAENNKIQREFHTIIGCISKSIFPTYDTFRLITTHIVGNDLEHKSKQASLNLSHHTGLTSHGCNTLNVFCVARISTDPCLNVCVYGCIINLTFVTKN